MSRSLRTPRLPLLPCIGVALMLVAAPAPASKLYQWKDANGVTHYSDAPPPAGASFTNRNISDRGSAGSQQKDADPAVAENEACTTARANLTLLQGEGAVGVDSDGDGKSDSEMSAGQRVAQTQLAEAAIKVHCTGAATAE